jgi:hypothetical protein
LAPSCKKRRHCPKPMPDEPPVIKIDLSLRLKGLGVSMMNLAYEARLRTE